MDDNDDFDDFMLFEAPMYSDNEDDQYVSLPITPEEKMATKFWAFFFIFIAVILSIALCGGCT